MMKQSEVNDYEHEISQDKASNFRGKARIKLDVLKFAPESMRELDRANVGRIKDIFESQGCLRNIPERHVPVVVGSDVLADAVSFTRSAEVSLDKLLTNPKDLPPLLEFPPGIFVECLTGKHRIQAAKECTTLNPSERWWIVDLYVEGLSELSKRTLSEEYSNSQNFSDGTIYRRISHYKSLEDRFAELQCWARLTKSKRDILKRFIKHESFSSAFDRLLPIQGLWTDCTKGLSIGTLHKMMGMKIDEEVIHYTTHILAIWEKILDNSQELMSLTDAETVLKLQSRAPGVSQNDLNFVTKLMDEGRIFRQVQDQMQRGTILKCLAFISYPIPTLYTLRQDLIYLRPCATILRSLFMGFGRRARYTIREAAERAFSGANLNRDQVMLQTSETSFETRTGSPNDQVEVGYRQVYAYAMRFVLDMTPDCAKKEEREDIPQPRKPNPKLWRGISTLAYRVGFESETIHLLRVKDTDREIARDMLYMARNPKLYKYPDNLLEGFQKQIVEIFENAVELPSITTSPPLFENGVGEDILRRCGRLYGTSYEDNQPFLFFHNLNCATEGRGKGVSSFFVRRSVYLAFFGVMSLGKHEPMRETQLNEDSIREPISDHQESEKVETTTTTNDTPTNLLKRGVEADVAQPFQFEFIGERPERFVVQTDRAKKLILSKNPDSKTIEGSTSGLLKIRPGARHRTGASRDRYTQNLASGQTWTPPAPQFSRSEGLWHKETSSAIPVSTVSISIWKDGKWSQVESHCTRDLIEERVTHHIWTVDGLHPYDSEGRGLAPEQYFDVVINERSKTLYLARPEDHAIAFEL